MTLVWAALVSIATTLAVEWIFKPGLEARKDYKLEQYRARRAVVNMARDYVWRIEQRLISADDPAPIADPRDEFVRIRSTIDVPKNRENRGALAHLTQIMGGRREPRASGAPHHPARLDQCPGDPTHPLPEAPSSRSGLPQGRRGNDQARLQQQLQDRQRRTSLPPVACGGVGLQTCTWLSHRTYDHLMGDPHANLMHGRLSSNGTEILAGRIDWLQKRSNYGGMRLYIAPLTTEQAEAISAGPIELDFTDDAGNDFTLYDSDMEVDHPLLEGATVIVITATRDEGWSLNI